MPLSTSGSLLLSSVNSEFFPNDNPVNTYNWYNKMTYGTAQGYSPTVTGSDPTVQIQMSNSTSGAGGYIYQIGTAIQNANQFVFTWDMFVNNTASGDYINLYFGSNSANTGYGSSGYSSYSGVSFSFQLYSNPGIFLYTNYTTHPNYSNYVSRSTSTAWAVNAWVNCMIVYQKGTIGTWNLYINGVNVISYSDPTNAGWLTQTGNVWGFHLFNGGAYFTSYLRNLNLSTNLPFAVVTPYNWYTNMITVNSAGTYTQVQSGTDPNVQLQLSNGTSTFNLQEAYVYNNFPVQNYGSFTLTFQFYLGSGFTANGFYVSFGNQSGITPYNSNSNNNKYSIYFNTWATNAIGGTGIYLINNTQNSYTASNYLASAAITWTTNAWNTIVINYSRNANETWRVSYNGTNYINYSNNSNQYWVDNLAGNYWIIGSTSNVQTFYIRQVNMVVTPSSGGNSQKLVTPLNWYTKMSVINFNGSYTAVTTGSDPNVGYQLSNSAQLEVGNAFYMQQRVQDYSSFTLQYEFKYNPGTGQPWDGVYAYFGTTNNSAYNSSNNGFLAFNTFNTNNGLSSQACILSTGTSTGWFTGTSGNILTPLMSNSWYSTTINYTKGTTGTWKVNINGNTVLNISDPNNTSWVSTSSGNYWGIGGNSGGGETGSYFIRKVQLSYVPSKVNFSMLSGISNGTSFVTSLPPSAMSSNTLTISGNSNILLNGTYTTSASGSLNAAYYAFNGIPQTIFQGWNSSSALYNTGYTSGSLYTGSNTTTVSSTSYSGEWVQIQVPNAVSVNSFLICSQPEYYFIRSPVNFILAGSNDSSTWSALHIATGVNNWGVSNSQTFVCNQNNTNSYSYFRLIIQNVYKANAGISNSTFTLGTTFAATPQLWGICYSPVLKMYTAVGIGSNGAASMGVYSIDGGATWTLNGLSTALSYYCAVWASALNMFIVPANGSVTVYTSTNGTTWTSNTGGNANGWNAICWSPELNLAVCVCNSGTSGTGVQTSNNGSTWTVRTTPSANTWTGVCWTPDINLFVAVGSSNTIMTSPDGFNWTTRSGPSGTSTNTWWGICWSSYLKLFCSVSTIGTTTAVMTSPNGITWTAQTNPNTCQWQGICWCPEIKLFLACGAGGSSNRFMSSPDGITWSTAGSIVSRSYRAICWSSNDLKAVAVHSTGGTNAAVYTGPDGFASIGLLNLYTNSGSNVSYSQLRGKTGTSSGLNSNCVLATDQGAYNSNTTYVSSFTTDTSARMIQIYGQAVGIGNQANTRHLLQQTYTNTVNSTIFATMTMSCQDFCKVYQNKVLIYPDFQVDANNFTFQVILDIGVNLFEFVCFKNDNGLGGFIYTLINNSGGAVLMRSDNNSATALTNTSKITITSSPAQVGPLDRIPSNYTCSGAYALVKLKAFPGSNLPVVQVRRSSDNATGNIYADWQGNLTYGNGYAGYPEGTSLANWLNGSTGYIVTWYDQSGNGNNATQATTGFQPALVWNTTGNGWTVDTQNSGTQYLNLPNNTLTVSTTDAVYSVILKHGTLRRTNYGSFLSGGTTSNNGLNEVAYWLPGSGLTGYGNPWYANDITNIGTTNTTGNIVGITYDGYGTRYGYVNGTFQKSQSGSGYNIGNTAQYIGYSPNAGYMNGQLYHLYIFKSNLGQYFGSGTSVNAIQDTSTITTLSNTLAYTSPLPNPCLNQVPVLDAISTTTKSACRGAYALVRLSMSYTGATVNIRRGLDNATSDFYADIQGNLNTAINNTGTTLSNWLQGTIGYVTIWYDQSGNGNNATQATNGLQPVISPFSNYPANDVNWLVDSQTSGTQRMLIPSGTVPISTTNAPYSFVFRHQAWNNTVGGILGAGTGATSQANAVRAGSDGSVGYYNYWYGNDFTLGSNAQRVAGNQVIITYNGSTQTGYINTTQITSVTHTGGTTAAGQQYLFSDTVGNYMNGQVYYFYIFNISIPDIDRLKLMTI